MPAGVLPAAALPLLAVAGLLALEREAAVFETARSWLMLRRARQHTDIREGTALMMVRQAPFVRLDHERVGLVVRDIPGAPDSVAAAVGTLVVVPYYVRPSTAGIIEHFRAVADASPVPVVLYNIPYRTGRALDADAVLALADHANISGIKQAVGSLDHDTLGAGSQGGAPGCRLL